ncbi:MAG: hypothetical protein LBM59_06940 [Ruminococcus sp.]|jgi:hypothetical protein|nr:hypothetical protein [Ruminococcus sp.]
MIKISKDFTLEDIRAIRDEYYEQHKDLNWKEMADETNAIAIPIFAEIRRRRAERLAREAVEKQGA